jgi:hypothetical protein
MGNFRLIFFVHIHSEWRMHSVRSWYQLNNTELKQKASNYSHPIFWIIFCTVVNILSPRENPMTVRPTLIKVQV